MTKRASGTTAGRHAGSGWTVPRAGRVSTLTFIALIFAVPIVTFILMGFREEGPIGKVPGGVFALSGLSIENMQRNWDIIMSFNHGIFTTWMTNSLIVAIGGSALAVFTAIPAGYALAMLRFRGRRVLRFITLLTMVMPNTVLVIPLFLEVSAVGGIGQLWPVIVIMGFYPFGVYLAYIHFLTTLPRELVEAARIDGLSEVLVFLRIAVPVSKQAVALVIFFSFVANWTNYFLPLVLLPLSEQGTVSLGLQQLVGSSPMFDPTSAAGLTTKLYMPQLALATTVTILPVLLVFIVAQRFLMRGAVVGAVKG
jgi:multiple sugar transport system permease protein